MVSGFLDRTRAQRLMAEQGLDALVLAQPESIKYATGAFPGVATFWRRAGAAFVIVPHEGPMTAIVGDLQAETFKAQSEIVDVRSHQIWVETGKFDGQPDIAGALVSCDVANGKPLRLPRPAQYDVNAAVGLLRDVLAEGGLLKARIGMELGFIAVRDFPVFTELMPQAAWVDATNLAERLRAIKSPREIDILRTASELSGAGLHALVRGITLGMDAARMTEIWRDAALAEASRRGLPPPASTWAYIAVGGDGFAPGAPAQTGDLIKIDVGCVIDGYSSDGGRTAVLGRAGRAEREVYDALHKSFNAGFALLQPGVELSDVYRIVATTMWDAGFSTYNRGHFGHGVGATSGARVAVHFGHARPWRNPEWCSPSRPYYIKGLAVSSLRIRSLSPKPHGSNGSVLA